MAQVSASEDQRINEKDFATSNVARNQNQFKVIKAKQSEK
jgi:hypothetical protein